MTDLTTHTMTKTREKPFDFTESFRRTLSDFDDLPIASRNDYYRTKAKADAMLAAREARHD